VIDLVGADRLLFGTDHPLLQAQRYIQQFDALKLSDDERTAVLGGSAAAMLGL
jgi:predicted TIM-barrel fold metal-dependent hydrolase